MKTSFRLGTMSVDFTSKYRDESTYTIYDRATHETTRITRNDATGELRAPARDVTQAESDAVMAYLANQEADYQVWRQQNASLFV